MASRAQDGGVTVFVNTDVEDGTRDGVGNSEGRKGVLPRELKGEDWKMV